MQGSYESSGNRETLHHKPPKVIKRADRLGGYRRNRHFPGTLLCSVKNIHRRNKCLSESETAEIGELPKIE